MDNHKSSDYFIIPGAQLPIISRALRPFFFLGASFIWQSPRALPGRPPKGVVIKHPWATTLVAWPSLTPLGDFGASEAGDCVTVVELSVKLILEINLLWLATRGNCWAGSLGISQPRRGLDRGIDYALALGVSRSKERWVLYGKLVFGYLYHISSKPHAGLFRLPFAPAPGLPPDPPRVSLPKAN